MSDEEAEAPFALADDPALQRARDRERTLEKLKGVPGIKNYSFDPLTRAGTDLAIEAVIDFEQRLVLEARVENRQPAYHELILKDRSPSDAVHISSRINGRRSGAHAIAACLALEMASGATPPPLAIIARNLGTAAELISEGIIHLFLTAGPDYSEKVMASTSPRLWQKARKTPAQGGEIHRLESIADIMRGLSAFKGHLYLEALQMSRVAAEIATMIFGKYPHPTTIVPGGITVELNRELLNLVLGRVNQMLDYAKKVVAIWDDLIEFFIENEPHSRRSGELQANLLSVGLWDDPDSYNAGYQNCNEWGARRQSPPAIIINGEKCTGRLSDINIGIEEFVDHSYYAQWNHQRFPADPLSGPLSPWHPWNKETIPAASRRDWKDRYSWSTAPRWDRETMETGPIARLWSTALSERSGGDFVGQGRRSMEMELPKGQRPPMRLKWRVPDKPGTLERLRAGAYHLAFDGLVAFASLLDAFDYLRLGDIQASVRFQVPEKSIGVGFWESLGGALNHYIVIRNHSLYNYQVLSSSEWLASPRDATGKPGICEAALINTPILEDFSSPEDFTGIDLLRTIRAFNP